jgi:aminopeptidase
MFADSRIEKLADMMINYSLGVKPGDKILIRGNTVTEPLLTALYQKTLEAGGFPFVVAELVQAKEIFFKYANEDQLNFVHPPYKQVFESYDGLISILGDANTRALSAVDGKKQAAAAAAMRPLNQIIFERAGKGELRWTLTQFPTHANAQDADMSLADYADFVFHATMPDLNDPVGYWQRFSAQQERLVQWLEGKKQVHVLAADTDLKLSIADRRFINCDAHNNVPDGEIFTGPVEDSMQGHVKFSYPTIYQGRELNGVELWFEEGRVVKASATKNEEFLLQTLDTDSGARYVGEFAIGTNEGIQQFTRNILFDEKIGGSFHMALGQSYPETGAVNQSAIHWDMICDLRNGGQIWVDDELFYENGKFLI